VTQLYAPDAIDVWHAVAHVNEFKREIRGRCRHDFMPKQPPVAKRPHKDKYCAGCEGVEEQVRAAGAKQPPKQTIGDSQIKQSALPPPGAGSVTGTQPHVGTHPSIVGKPGDTMAQIIKP